MKWRLNFADQTESSQAAIAAQSTSFTEDFRAFNQVGKLQRSLCLFKGESWCKKCTEMWKISGEGPFFPSYCRVFSRNVQNLHSLIPSYQVVQSSGVPSGHVTNMTHMTHMTVILGVNCPRVNTARASHRASPGLGVLWTHHTFLLYLGLPASWSLEIVYYWLLILKPTPELWFYDSIIWSFPLADNPLKLKILILTSQWIL